MKYRLGFDISGAVSIESDDPQEALEDAEQYSKVELAKYASKIKFTYIEDMESKEKIVL